MAVSSLHYTMGISSGFKVYILEGQHTARNVDRLQPLTNHLIPVYPIKRKHSPDPLPRPSKRLSASNSQSRVKMTTTPTCQKPPARQPPSRSFGPKEFGHHPITLQHVLKTLMIERKALENKERQGEEQDQPLALVKRLERPSEQPMVSSAMLQQNRPSVITCISRQKSSSLPAISDAPLREAETQRSPRTCSPEVEEHFQRSLQSFGTQMNLHTSPSQFAHSSVEDHFSKALGSKWLLIRAAADSASSLENRTRCPL
ncbi:uncharacterized protein PAF06_000165 [Gastrophryne carolinensis]